MNSLAMQDVFARRRIFYLVVGLLFLCGGLTRPAVAESMGEPRMSWDAPHAPGRLVVRYTEPLPGSAAFKAATPLAPSTRPDYLVKLDRQFGLQTRRSLAAPTRSKAQLKGAKLEAATAANDELARTEVLEFEPGVDLRAAQQAYAALGVVQRAEPDFISTLGSYPSDPLFPRQRAIFDRVGLPAAWDVQSGIALVLVAVLDSGCDTAHEDLQGTISSDAYDFLTASHQLSDDLGHGTRVCSLIGARAYNGQGMAGAAYGVTLLPLDIVDSTGVILNSNVIAALDYAVARGADVINMSFSSAAYSSLVADAVARARASAVLVAAVGNEGRNDAARYPAAYEGVIGVAASMADSPVRAGFSNYNGPTVAMADLAAPGEGVLAAFPGDLYDADYGNGTSFAAPLVSAAAALLRGRYLTQSAQAITQHLLATASSAARDYTANGMLNAAAAMTTPMLPHFTLNGVTVDDAVAYAPATNNGDGRLDRGEVARLVIGLANGGADAWNVSGTVATTAADIGPLGHATAQFGSIVSNATGTNAADPFTTVTVSASALAQVTTFTLRVQSTLGGQQLLTFNLPIDNVVQISGVKLAYPFSASKTYHVTGNLMLRGTTTIPPGTRFKVDPGVDIRADTGCDLTAVGTAAQPIVFTSAGIYRHDDRRGPGLSDPDNVGPKTVPVDLAAYQQVRYVSANTGDDVTTAGTATRPWRTIQYALAQIPDASISKRYALLVAEGTYTGGGTHVVPLKLNIDIYGGFAPRTWQRDIEAHRSTIDGEGVRRGVEAYGTLWDLEHPNPASIDGFRVTRGTTGVLLSNVEARVTNLDIYRNSGEACYFIDSRLVVRNCQIRENPGGVYCDVAARDNTYAEIRNTSINNNGRVTYYSTTGATLDAHQIVFCNNLIVGNHGIPGYGGDVVGVALRNRKSTRISDCSILGNDGRYAFRFAGQLCERVLVRGNTGTCGIGRFDDASTDTSVSIRGSVFHQRIISYPVVDIAYENCLIGEYLSSINQGSFISSTLCKSSSAQDAVKSNPIRFALNSIVGYYNSFESAAYSNFVNSNMDQDAVDRSGPNNVILDPGYIGIAAYGLVTRVEQENDSLLTHLSLADASLVKDQLKGAAIDIGSRQYAIESNTENTLTIWGNPLEQGGRRLPLLWTIPDWHLRADSPLIKLGAGTAHPTYGSSVPATDIDGDPRGSESSSIGCDEYSPETAPKSPWGHLRITPQAVGARFQHVTVDSGSGVLNENSASSFVDCRFERNLSTGLASSSATPVRVERVVARYNYGGGIETPAGTAVTSCTSERNVVFGIVGGDLVDCTARDNGSMGISGVSATRCTAMGNAGDGLVLTGGASACLAQSNNGRGIVASGGNIAASSSIGNNGRGIEISGGGKVLDSSVSYNTGGGVLVEGSTVENCLVLRNTGVGVSGWGEFTAVQGSRILENSGDAVSNVQTVIDSAIASNGGAISAAQVVSGVYVGGNNSGGVTGGSISNSTIFANTGSGVQSLSALYNSWVVRNKSVGVLSAMGVGPISRSTIRGNVGGVRNVASLVDSNVHDNGSYEAMDDVTEGTADRLMRQCYWGAANTALLNASEPFEPLPFLIDAQDGSGEHVMDVWPYAFAPVPDAPDATAPAFLLEMTPRADEPANAQVTTFTLTFSEPMNPAVAPKVTFDVEAPYTKNVVTPTTATGVTNGWVSATVWRGSYPIDTMTGNGLQTLRVSGAVAADGFLIPDDVSLHFTIDTSGSTVANNGIATLLGGGKARIEWNRSLSSDTIGYKLVRTLHGNESGYRELTGMIPQGSSAQMVYDDPTVALPGTQYSYKVYRVTAWQSDLIWTGPLHVTTPAIPGAPVILPIADQVTTAGLDYRGPTPGLERGSAPVLWELMAAPQGMTINSATGQVACSPIWAADRPHTITMRATNSLGSDDVTWQLSVRVRNALRHEDWAYYE